MKLKKTDPGSEEIFRRHLDKKSEWHEPEKNVYHASKVWNCLRKNYYTLTGVKETKPKPFGIFAAGKMAEVNLEHSYAEHYGPNFVKNNVNVRILVDNPLGGAGKFWIVGETDPVIFGWNLTPIRILEGKSSRAGAKSDLGAHHLRQASIYSYAIANRFKKGAEKFVRWDPKMKDVSKLIPIRVVTPSRDDYLNVADHDIEDPKIILDAVRSAVHYFTELHIALKKKRLPKAVPKMNWECNYCPFLDKCRKDGGWRQEEATRGRQKGRMIWVRTAR